MAKIIKIWRSKTNSGITLFGDFHFSVGPESHHGWFNLFTYRDRFGYVESLSLFCFHYAYTWANPKLVP